MIKPKARTDLVVICLLKRTGKMAVSLMKRPRCPFLLLIYILLTILSQCGLGLAQILDIRLDPSFVHDLKTKESKKISVGIAYDMAKLERRQLTMRLMWEIRDEKVAKIVDQSIDNYTLTTSRLMASEEGSGKNSDEERNQTGFANSSLTLKGLFIGKTKLRLNLQLLSESRSSNQPKSLKDQTYHGSLYREMDIWVQIGDRTLIAVFVSTLGCLIILANLLMGCQLNLDVVWSVLKRPVAPCIGFVCQFLLMPLIAYSLARAIMNPAGLYTLGLGLFTTGCVPGGGASNFWTILLEGNSDLSITMTAVSTVAAFGMMPLWMFLMGEHFLEGHPEAKIEIPYKNILLSLSCLIVPLFIGVLIRKFRPKIAEAAGKVLRPFLIFIIVFILSFGVYANLYMFQLMTWRVLVSGLLLPWCGFMFGCFAGLVSRQPPANVAAIAIETGIQNAGIAIMLLKVSFPQPDADMASVVPVVVSIFTPGPLLLGVAVHQVMKFMKKRQETKDGALKKGITVGKDQEVENGGVENIAVTYKGSPTLVRIEEVSPLAPSHTEGGDE